MGFGDVEVVGIVSDQAGEQKEFSVIGMGFEGEIEEAEVLFETINDVLFGDGIFPIGRPGAAEGLDLTDIVKRGEDRGFLRKGVRMDGRDAGECALGSAGRARTRRAEQVGCARTPRDPGVGNQCSCFRAKESAGFWLSAPGALALQFPVELAFGLAGFASKTLEGFFLVDGIFRLKTGDPGGDGFRRCEGGGRTARIVGRRFNEEQSKKLAADAITVAKTL